MVLHPPVELARLIGMWLLRAFRKPLRTVTRNRLNLHEGKSDAWVFRNHLILGLT